MFGHIAVMQAVLLYSVEHPPRTYYESRSVQHFREKLNITTVEIAGQGTAIRGGGRLIIVR